MCCKWIYKFLFFNSDWKLIVFVYNYLGCYELLYIFHIMKKFVKIFIILLFTIWITNAYEIQDFLDMLKNGVDLNDLINDENLGTDSFFDVPSDYNYYDNNTYQDNGVVNTSDNYRNDTTMWSPSDILDNWFTRELNEAYNFAYDYGITTQGSIYSANMNWWLDRISMAKMLSEYAVNVLWLSYDTSRSCYFADISQSISQAYNDWACKAYYLGIMWQNMANNNFRPFDTVTRAEFATALSRLLYGTPDWWDVYYSTHLSKLYDEWIISNTNPSLLEKRWYVMLMLMRSQNK